MTRVFIWACIGWLLGVLALGVCGAWYGYANGLVEGRLPPGPQAAWREAFVFTAYFWWLAGGVGAVFGGLTGLGSDLVGRWVEHKRASRQGHLPSP
jgi:hypothetical protein